MHRKLISPAYLKAKSATHATTGPPISIPFFFAAQTKTQINQIQIQIFSRKNQNFNYVEFKFKQLRYYVDSPILEIENRQI